ncbi:MAG TPA: hypothetical protein VD966_00095 [Pyrinomonadaceae bacterium]|nr:hypothetical protein [Pyrinomonadaceae bacterium]
MFVYFLLVVTIVLITGYLVLRFNSLWIYRLFDRALRNEKHHLDERYEIPRYYVLKKGDELNTSVKWPGWDGWYFFFLPEEEDFPVKMIRCSLMTGLYGLDGIDDYQKLSQSGLNSFNAVEYLTLVPSDEKADETKRRENNLSQHYLPKATDLIMSWKQLDTTITTVEVDGGADVALYGRMRGAWPNYTFQFTNTEAKFKCDLKYQGDSIVWWADVPNLFTYFAAFGKFQGEISYLERKLGGGGEEIRKIKGVGAFEHGFARKPFNFDLFWLPVKLLQKVFPRFNPIRYNYQLFIGANDWQGGFMQAIGFGINFRNRGGFHFGGRYRPINGVKVQYLDDPLPDIVTASGRPEKFYRRWKVKAETDDGTLEYVATREGPPPRITGNMMYYFFTYEGAYQGQSVSGRGYGEYLIM